MKLILASGSPRRREIMNMLGVDFEVLTSECDENVSGNPTPAELVKTLALRKASAVLERLDGDSVVIGADTVVCDGKTILGKPKNAADAVETLLSLSDKWHSVYTGLAVIGRGKTIAEALETRVRFVKLTRGDCERYVLTGEPLDKAGSYGIQGLGGLFVERIDGDYYNVVGLPVSRLRLILTGEFGLLLPV